MIAAPTEPELLYPLTLFFGSAGRAVPAFQVIDSAEMPQPYRGLLVHQGDMTSRLEEFHGGAMELRVLHREHTPTAYRREVVLQLATTGIPVEYGAIEIHLEAFSPELRALIIEAHLPLGGLLNQHRVQYRSEPKAFIKLSADTGMSQVFGLEQDAEFFGRCNVLRGEHDEVLATIVEVLRPLVAGGANSEP